MESNKTERERIDLSPSQSQNPSNTQEETADLEMKVPEITVYSKETENQNNKRSQRKNVRREKTNLAPDYKYWWARERRDHPGAAESNAPLDLDTGPNLTNINNNTEDVIKSDSEDSTVSSAPNALVKHSMSAEALSGAEEYLPTENIENCAVKETGSSSQDMTNPSPPDAAVKYTPIALPAENCPPPTNGQKNTRKEKESGSQELPISSASAGVSPNEQFPLPPKINDNTETVTGSGSLDLTAFSTPKVPVKDSASADVLPSEKNTAETMESNKTEREMKAPETTVIRAEKDGGIKETGSGSLDLTASFMQKVPVKDSASTDVLPSKENTETMESNKSEREMKASETMVIGAEKNDGNKETGSGSLDLTASSMPKVPVKDSASADVLPSKENTETMESNKTENEMKAPETTVIRAEKDDGIKETESSLQDFTNPSAPDAPVENPSNTRAAASVLEMKAPAIIVSRAKVRDEPWLPTDWVPEDDNIHPSAEELEAGLTFEKLYNVIRHRDGSPPPSPNN